MVSKKSKSNIKLIEKLLNQNLKGINFFQGDLTRVYRLTESSRVQIPKGPATLFAKRSDQQQLEGTL